MDTNNKKSKIKKIGIAWNLALPVVAAATVTCVVLGVKSCKTEDITVIKLEKDQDGNFSKSSLTLESGKSYKIIASTGTEAYQVLRTERKGDPHTIPFDVESQKINGSELDWKISSEYYYFYLYGLAKSGDFEFIIKPLISADNCEIVLAGG